ncbi:MAG: hypothetical protein BWY46_01674 [Firmicutes bacterium ADurb.Bin300]|nr:MAG: hypothetical protein BWY46_01674 [Firmicutes bacterium ADurb.Bin300]
MSKLKLGLKLLRSNAVPNIIVAMQLTVVVILCCNLLSQLDLLLLCNTKIEKINGEEYSVFLPYSEYSFTDVSDKNSFDPGNIDILKNSLDFSDLSDIKYIIDVKYTEAYESDNFSGKAYDVLVYDEACIEYFPIATKGNAAFNLEDDNEYIDAFITSGDSSLSVGDTVSLYLVESGNITPGKPVELIQRKVRIKGEIKDPAYMLHLTTGGNINSVDLFENVSKSISGLTTLIIDEKQAIAGNLSCQSQQGRIVVYDKDISLATVQKNEKLMASKGYVVSKAQIKANSDEAKSWVMETYFPKVCFLLLVALTGMIAAAIINTSGTLKAFRIFYICGCRWKDCIKISLINTAVITIIAGLISFLLLKISYFFNLSTYGFIFTSANTYMGCILVLLLFWIVSTIAPMVILRKNKP